MNRKQSTKKGSTKGKAEGNKEGKRAKKTPTLAARAAGTAERLAALLEDPRLPSSLYAALSDELNDFAALAGGITGPDVLLAAYPAICEAAGFDGLAAAVEAMQRPQREEQEPETTDEPEYEYFEEEGRDDLNGSRSPTMQDNSLAHWGIFKYDHINYEPTARIKRRKHVRQIRSGDLIVLKVKKPREGEPEALVGEVRFEPGKVVLVSHQPGQTRRAFSVRDVIVLGRVEGVSRRIQWRTFYRRPGAE